MAPHGEPVNSVTDGTDSFRLQRKLRLQIAAGVLLTTALVGLVASLQFYQMRKQATIGQLQTNLHIGLMALDARLAEHRSIARHVTSRTRIRQVLLDF